MRHWAIRLIPLVVALGCYSMAEPPSEKQDTTARKSGRSEFAAERLPRDVAEVPFDTKRAMGYIDALCKLGPRISGTEGMKKQQEYLKKHFEALGGKVRFQEFKATQRGFEQPTEMANLIVSWHPDRTRRVILCSHYDTRPVADQEPDERRWREPFVSANDGGSGVALLAELAHHMKDLKTDVGVDFVLFDGEEFVYKKGDKYFFGSEYFGTTYKKERPPQRYVAGVLLDMIGGKNPHFPVEINSWVLAQPLVNELWGTAKELSCTAFQYANGPEVQDDHLALNRAGIPTVDIIDFSYKHWHRLSDVPGNCSPEGLEQVARVLATWLQRIK